MTELTIPWTTPEKAEQAALNNALWCDTICRTHGNPGRFRTGAWVNPGPVPLFYPNAVTLGGTVRAETHRQCLRELIQAGMPEGGAIKDSFQTLELTPLGFRVLFEAQWVYRPAASPGPELPLPGVNWQPVTTPAALAAWETAWSGGAEERGIFLPPLLMEEGVMVIAAYRQGRVVAGAVASRGAGAVGLSNIFVPTEKSQEFRSGCVARAMEAFPGLPLVGYEADMQLAAMQALGFETVGRLRIWRWENKPDENRA